MTINTVLLQRTLAHIEAHPQEWRQAMWRCETGMCFAGWTAELAGGRWVTDPDQAYGTYLHPEPGDDPSTITHLDGLDAQGVHPADRAQRVLGLDIDQADDLFFAGNSLEDLRWFVAELCAAAEAAT